jgi:hypothetical protein
MTAPHADQLTDGYLARLRVAAADLPSSVRDELIEDMRAHIIEARNREPQDTDATILNILDRLGEPLTVVADARDRLGIRPPQPYRPGALDLATVILVLFAWPIGVILLWISPAWRWRDKLVGALVPPGGLIGAVWFGSTFATTHTGAVCLSVTLASAQAIQNSCQPALGQSPLQAALWSAAAILLYGLSFITAGYLALRLRWARQAQLALS